MTNISYMYIDANDEDTISSVENDAEIHMFGKDMENACFASECNLTQWKYCSTFGNNARTSEKTILAIEKKDNATLYAGSLHLVRRGGFDGYFLHSFCVRQDLRGHASQTRGDIIKPRVGNKLLKMAKDLNEAITLNALNVYAEDYNHSEAAKVLEERKRYVFAFYEKNGFKRMPTTSKRPAFYTYEWQPN